MISIIFKNKYNNPFDFPVTLKQLDFDVTNGTSGTWASYSMSEDPVSIEGNGHLNVTSKAKPEKSEITTILSDLVSGVEDMFVYKKIHAVFQIESFEFEIYIGSEIVKSDLDFALEIVDYTIIPLTIDIEFVNPSGINFNLTYIDITIYLADTTKKAIWYADYVEKPPHDYIPVISCGKTRVDGIAPSFNLINAIAALEDGNNVDMIGYFSVNCYQYADDVPFRSYDVEM